MLFDGSILLHDSRWTVYMYNNVQCVDIGGTWICRLDGGHRN